MYRQSNGLADPHFSIKDDILIGVVDGLRGFPGAIQPGNPQQNAYVKRYNRTVRYDWLAHYLLDTIEQVQHYATKWLWTYNHERPNTAIGGMTPKQKLALAA
jgi:hypothetical protein